MSVNDNGEEDFYENNCIECNEIDNMHMVQCDICDRWAHFECVGIDPGIESEDLCCELCRTKFSS